MSAPAERAIVAAGFKPAMYRVHAFDRMWLCAATVDEDGATLESVFVGGVEMPASLLNPKVVRVLEQDCWALFQRWVAA